MSDENPFRVLGSRPIYDNPWIGLTEHQVVRPNGSEGVYGVVHFKNRAVGVVPYADGYVWLVGQYRFPLERYSWELPEGGAPFDEDPAACALRELAEETGLRAGRLAPLLTMHLSNSVTDEISYVFLATDLTPGAMAPDETEVLRVRKLRFDDAYAEVESGAITDSITVAAILRLKVLAHEGRLARWLAGGEL